MKKLNDLINNLETYKELTTVPRDTLIKELKECKAELTEQLRLHSVSQQREQLSDLIDFSNNNAPPIIQKGLKQVILEFNQSLNCG
tara:strand:+ start:273 stop:530 length:258 start_codon:yes stop_codon:yes gene_type:complete